MFIKQRRLVAWNAAVGDMQYAEEVTLVIILRPI